MLSVGRGARALIVTSWPRVADPPWRGRHRFLGATIVTVRSGRRTVPQAATMRARIEVGALDRPVRPLPIIDVGVDDVGPRNERCGDVVSQDEGSTCATDQPAHRLPASRASRPVVTAGQTRSQATHGSSRRRQISGTCGSHFAGSPQPSGRWRGCRWRGCSRRRRSRAGRRRRVRRWARSRWHRRSRRAARRRAVMPAMVPLWRIQRRATARGRSPRGGIVPAAAVARWNPPMPSAAASSQIVAPRSVSATQLAA